MNSVFRQSPENRVHDETKNLLNPKSEPVGFALNHSRRENIKREVGTDASVEARVAPHGGDGTDIRYARLARLRMIALSVKRHAMIRHLWLIPLALTLTGCVGLAAFSSALDGVMQPQESVVYGGPAYESSGYAPEIRCWQSGPEYRCREL
jgi:hypothetical protein